MTENLLLKDIKKIQGKGGEISTDAAIQLIMTSLISLDANFEKLHNELECSSNASNRFQTVITGRVEDIKTQVEHLTVEMEDSKTTIQSIEKRTENWCLPNPMLSFGCFIKNNPKLFMGFITTGILLVLLLGIPEVKHSIILFLGFPDTLANFIAPIP